MISSSRIAQENVQLKNEIEHLQQIIRLLKRDKFGSKSEKLPDLDQEQFMFNELETLAKNAESELSEQTELIEGYERKKKGRGKKKPFPADLPREEVVVDLIEAEKICPHDGSRLKEIGEEITEKLKVIPARLVVIVERKKKYACTECECYMAQAKSPQVLPGTIATVEMIAFLIFSKFFQGLPFYRIEELFKLQGVDLKRGTMASWLIAVSLKLQPVWNVLEDWALETGYIGIDETRVQVLKEVGRKPETKSSMWARGSPELGIVLFDYDVSSAGHVAERLITGFTGSLQSDAHQGYNRLNDQVHRLGCMMHSRRRFHEAYLAAKKMPGNAEVGMRMIKKLYKLEEAYKDQGLTNEQRYEARQLEVKPYMEKIKNWCLDKKSKVLPQGPLGNAISYYLDEYEKLTGFLADGRLEIDNGWIERAIRKFAIGRNNWLFCDTVDGAKASSLFYSLVITAKLNGKDPFTVMVEILSKINRATTIEDFEALAKLLVRHSSLH
jgi:transposase